MRIVYSWLKDFVDIDVPAKELADALTYAGLEVASIEDFKVPAGIKVAKVLETSKHPNADKLSLCKVDNGSGEILSIVCGAPNVRPGMITALAQIGTKLSPDFVIKKAKIRGIESYGMLCSQQELGLSEDHSGIMDLDPDCKIGEELSVYFPDDTVIEIEITPDRGDCLSILGVAREICAKYGLPLKDPSKKPLENSGEKTSDAITVKIESVSGCPRYCGRLVRGVKIGASPQWMQQRLSLGGIRPINNVVDITNYILIQYGQPMHAFDYSSINGHKIIVKMSAREQPFTTLDGLERKLLDDDLLICDEKHAVALAGIMGGAGSQIQDSTTDVFLECAYFEPVGIRKTSKRLGLSTDSSYRFERGVDPDKALIDSLNTAAQLMKEIAGGQISEGLLDVYPQPLKCRNISIRPSRASKLLGVQLSKEQIVSYLTSLGIKCSDRAQDSIDCTIPLFRHDLSFEVDLIEETGRLFGYDNIVPSEKASVSLYTDLPSIEKITDRIRHACAFSGLNEIVTNSLTSESKCAFLTPEKKPVKLLNPLNPEMAGMRTTLAGSMMEILSYNLNRKNLNNQLFEIGKIFQILPSGEFEERDILGIVIEGNYLEKGWNTSPVPVDFYILKGILERLAIYVGTGSFVFESESEPGKIFEGEVSRVIFRDLIKGTAGRVSLDLCKFFDIETPVFYAEIDITDFLQSPLPHPVYKPLPKFPALERDFCFVMDESISASSIISIISDISPLIEEVTPFDLYRGEKLGPCKKSITFSVKFRSPEKTLTDKESEAISSAIVKKVHSELGAKLRS